MNSIDKEVIDLVSKITNRKILLDTELAEIDINSMMMIKIIVDIETKFNIEVPDAYLSYSYYRTIRDISSMVQNVL